MKSMTGFGSAEATFRGESLTVDIKTLNNRFLEFKVRGPRDYSSFEPAVIEETKKVLQRGSVEISIQREVEGSYRTPRHHLNFKLARYYALSLRKLKKDLKISGALTLDHFISLPDLWISSSDKLSSENHWPIVRRLLIKALRRVDQARSQEGAVLERVILGHLFQLEQTLGFLTRHKAKLVQAFQEKLKQRISHLLGSNNLDSQRLHQEVAYLVDRTDVTEELDRLKIHIKQFRVLLKSKGAIGKNCDFLIQEMNREVNTVGSKIQDVKLTAQAVQCKGLLEKIREQIQNVE